MRNFRYDDSSDEMEIESILKKRKRKIAKQQVVFSCILAAILLVIAAYVGKKVLYTEFDGYLNTDYNDIRAADDIFLMKVYKDVGDLVVPGDTLFSYVYLSHFNNNENLNSESNIVSHNRDMRIQTSFARQDIEVLRVRIREIKRQLAVADHNISFGLADNEHKLELEKELAETEEQLKVQQRKLGVLYSEAKDLENQSDWLTGTGTGIPRFESVRNLEEMKGLGLLRYSIVTDSAVVTKISFPDYMTVFKKESIVQIQSLDLQKVNLGLVGYVPVDKMGKINRNTRAEIIVNDEISFSASVSILGTRTETIPEALRSKLSKDYMAVVVEFRVDPGQTIPFWVFVKHIPVTIRINNFGKHEKKTINYMYFNTSTGVILDSLEIEKIEWKQENGIK